MLRERAKLFRELTQTTDLLITFISFIVTYYTLGYFPAPWLAPLLPLKDYLWLFFIILPLWWLLLRIHGFYNSRRIKSMTSTAWIIIKTGIMIALVTGTFAFFFNLHHINRTFIFTFIIINVSSLIAEHFIARFILRIIRKRGYNYRELLIAGTGKRAVELTKKVLRHTWWGFRIVGFVDKDPEMVGKEILGIKIIGTLNDIPRLVKEQVIDEIIFSVPRNWLNDIEAPIYACEEMGIKTKLAADLFNPLIAKSHLDDLDGIPLLTLSTTPQKAGQLLIKQAFDIITSLFLLIILSPIFLIIALAIKISSSGPVFFKQIRCGLNGRKFFLYKFRSMVDNAEKMKARLEKYNEADSPVFKIRNDPRITLVGKFLRKTSMDELPQLFNVLRGNMSLVGSRPPLPSEVDHYKRSQRRRLSMKPGITCLWQINGRSEVNFDTWMKMDLEYIDNWSLALDCRILIKTIPAILFSRGAM